MSSQRPQGPPWASLPPDLMQLTASLLEGEDRLALMHVCTSWNAAVLAAPHLVPTAVLTLPAVEVAEIQGDQLAIQDVKDALWQDFGAGFDFIEGAAPLGLLYPWTPAVRVQGSGDAQVSPLLISDVLLVLPAGPQRLELAVPCAGAMLPALARFSRLEALRIPGNSTEIAWGAGGRRGRAVLGRLEQLCLDYRHTSCYNGYNRAAIEVLPPNVSQSLSAGHLHSLELRLCWSLSVPALCAALPALRQLSLHVYTCIPADAVAAAGMLASLPQLSSAALGIHAHWGTEEDELYPNTDEFEHEAQLPRLAALAASLSELVPVGKVSLPPDWRQLTSLQHLHLHMYSGGGWGTAPLCALAALTCIDLPGGFTPEAPMLATAPCLAEVQVTRSCPSGWSNQLRELCPDVAVNVV